MTVRDHVQRDPAGQAQILAGYLSVEVAHFLENDVLKHLLGAFGHVLVELRGLPNPGCAVPRPAAATSSWEYIRSPVRNPKYLVEAVLTVVGHVDQLADVAGILGLPVRRQP